VMHQVHFPWLGISKEYHAFWCRWQFANEVAIELCSG
jgi:hypothetical protein